MSAAASSAEQQQQQQINTDQILEVVRKAIEAERARIQPIQNLRTERDRTKARYVETCPAGLQPCDPDEENKNGRTCPDADLYAPNPLIVDVKGRICYAPADLKNYAGGDVNGQQIEVLTEMFAGRLLQLIQKDAETAKLIQSALLNDGITSALGSGNYNASLCSVKNEADNTCSQWNLSVVENLDTDDLNKGLRYAIQARKAENTNTNTSPTAGVGPRSSSSRQSDARVMIVPPRSQNAIQLKTHFEAIGGAKNSSVGDKDCVFTAYDNAFFSTKSANPRAPYDKQINPATLAFAGAFAWATRADHILIVANEQPRFVARVVSLANGVRSINESVYKARFNAPISQFKEYIRFLHNLTFDIAWPIILSGQVTWGDMADATAAVQKLDKLDDISVEQFKVLTPAQQWKAIVDQHLKTVKV